VSFTPLPLYSLGKSSQHALDRRLGRSWGQFGLRGVQKLLLTLPEIESRPSSPNSVSVPTELSRLTLDFYLFIYLWLYSPIVGPWPLFQFLCTVGNMPRTGNSPSQGRYKRTQIYIYIYTSSGIRTHNPSVRTSEVSSCLRPCGHCDRLTRLYLHKIKRVR
jgi:hypothetical protein